MSEHLLSVKDLHTSFTTDNGEVHAVNGVSFNLDAGKVLALGSPEEVTSNEAVINAYLGGGKKDA